MQGNTGYSAGDTDNPFSGYRSFEQFRSNRKDDYRNSNRVSRDVESNKYSSNNSYQRKSSNSYSSSNKYSSGYNSGGEFFKTLAFKVFILSYCRLQLWRFWLQFWQQLWIRCEEGE